jgi:hypothetical protein
LGCDPEIFVRDGASLLPAFEFLPDKKAPKRFEQFNQVGTNLPDHCYANVFWDGFQAEFNTPPQSCIAWIADGVRCGLDGILSEAQIFKAGAKLTTQNVFQIPSATLLTARDEHVMLGCDASENAYGMMGEHVIDSRKLRHRFAGGHIHIGTNHEFFQLDKTQAIKIIRTLDKILGVWAVGAAEGIDNPIRRQYYGLAGEFRMPPHGVEYRTLSNFWFSHPGLVNLVFMMTHSIIRTNSAVLDRWVAHPQETVETINNCDVPRARKLLKDNEEVFKEIMGYYFYSNDDAIMKVAQLGIGNVVKDVEAFEENWKLAGKRDWHGHAGVGESWYSLQKIAA